jgi:Protein of unknown function (DUF2521).
VVALNIDLTFMKKRRERQIQYEQSVLRDISYRTLKDGVEKHFGNFIINGRPVIGSTIEEICYDMAIEAYLAGSRYSRLGYYGEPQESVFQKSAGERAVLGKELADYFFGGNWNPLSRKTSFSKPASYILTNGGSAVFKTER